MGSERKTNSELRWLAAEGRQAAVDREEHGLLIIFERPEAPERPEDEPLVRENETE
jgi:hypothetical protein